MQAKNIAITDICEKCNLSQSTIYKILAAKQTSVEIHTLHQLAKDKKARGKRIHGIVFNRYHF